MEKQIRGNCQGCGRLQAATKGTLAHHGYTVEYGYFHGTCYGAQELPLQVSRALLDKNVVGAKAHAQKLRDRADDIRFKRETPAEIVTQEYRAKGRYCSEKPEIRTPWAELSVWDQDRWRKITSINLDNSADQLERWCKDMLELADKVHGQPLIEVDRPGSDAKKINVGDKSTLR